jgi:hypothetical protein
MRSESTNALGHPSDTKLTLGAAACCMSHLPD